eukprot:CAMPEP_0206417190 /NCGR_PEP_ID=MMETSP0294-20121207/37195_1 /ASSEMBLY_ACC=CAM_ASM_000327 /TAXON_ID=39354 /ORGANISM="Heterosigma akashiwo, Strain CCMP2393" /LENGTH=200 /DNA_ID=CAMNT_0053879989 /DNA_START=103 /DNA_END=706 /DNA_ORIENTATION=-
MKQSPLPILGEEGEENNESMIPSLFLAAPSAPAPLAERLGRRRSAGAAPPQLLRPGLALLRAAARGGLPGLAGDARGQLLLLQRRGGLRRGAGAGRAGQHRARRRGGGGVAVVVGEEEAAVGAGRRGGGAAGLARQSVKLGAKVVPGPQNLFQHLFHLCERVSFHFEKGSQPDDVAADPLSFSGIVFPLSYSLKVFFTGL